MKETIGPAIAPEEHRIPMEGALNVRDLGGYPTEDGKITRRGCFLRADGTQNLTEQDIRALCGMGLRLCVDLRSPQEAEQMPSRLREADGVEYCNIPMFDGVQSGMLQGKMPESMDAMYRSFLDDCKEQYRLIFSRFAACRGLSLFHCTAGKDRTGVAAMLLLKLAGVSDALVVEDYAASERLLAPLIEKQKAQLLEKLGLRVPDYVMRSAPESMERTLRHLHERYGSAEAYLLRCGVTKEDIQALREKLIEEADQPS